MVNFEGDMDVFYFSLYEILVRLISVFNCYIVIFDKEKELFVFLYFSDV